MLVLGLDSSLAACSVAIARDGAVLASCSEPLERGHAERLPLMARDMLAAAGVAVGALDRVGVVIGPGAFAGVRVGLAFARGLALGTKLQVVGVGSLRALAAMLPAAGLRAAAIDARRGEVYCALYDAALEEIEAPFAATPEAARERLFQRALGRDMAIGGDGAGLLAPFPAFVQRLPVAAIDPAVVAALAAIAPAPSAPPAPLYLRPPDARPGAKSRFAALLEGGGS